MLKENVRLLLSADDTISENISRFHGDQDPFLTYRLSLHCVAGEESKSWIAMGNMFLKLPTRQSCNMLAQDQVQLVVNRFIVWQGRRARAE
jgi:hypothetical protein